MTNVDYAVEPSNASQEYFSNISSVLGAAGWQDKANCSRGGVIRKRHQGVRSEARTGAPVGAWRTPSLCCTCAGERRLPNQPASQARRSQPECPSRLKKVKHLTYEATPDSATVRKLCFQPAQAHPPDPVPPHPCLVEPQAPLHAHHIERKTKTYVFEVD